MNCPSCEDERLAITERQGVEIDYCPRCRGVWLDRGELDKLIERAAPAPAPAPAEAPYREPAPAYREPAYRDHDRGYGYEQPYGYKKKKPKSILSEIFDF